MKIRRQMCKIPKARAKVTVDSHICPKNNKKKPPKKKTENGIIEAP